MGGSCLKAKNLALAAEGLIEEVFVEEERNLTRTYEATLRLLATGEWRLNVISQKLYSAGLTSNPSPTTASGILNVLERIGLVRKIPLWRTRGARSYYILSSSAIAMLLYVDEKFLEIEPPPENLKSRYALEVQFSIGELLAEYHGLTSAYSISANRDLDVVLLDRRGIPQIAYEIKLGRITEDDVRESATLARSLGIPRFGAVSLEEKPEIAWLDEAYGPEELTLIAEELVNKSVKK